MCSTRTSSVHALHRPARAVREPDASEGVGAEGGGIAALLRHAIAGVLNATHPDIAYPLSVSQIIALVNSALASGDPDEIKEFKDLLASYNELGSDLDANGRASP